MRNKTRKFIWSAPIVAALAIVGALALFGVLAMPNADNAEAQSIAPEAPELTLTATVAKIKAVWRPGDDGGAAITSYDLQYVQSDTAPTSTTVWTSAGTFPISTRTYTFENLTNDKVYYVRVRATNSVGSSEWAQGMATPKVQVPSAPGDVTAVQRIATGNFRVSLSWGAPTDNGGNAVSGYRLYTATYNEATPPVLGAVTPLDAGAIDADPDTADVQPLTKDSTMANLTLAAGKHKVYVLAVNSATPEDSVIQNSGTGDDDTSAISDAEITAAKAGAVEITVANTLSVKNTYFANEIESSSKSPNGGPDITVTFTALEQHLSVGSSIILYLEDDFVEPDSIAASAVYFVASGGTSADDGENFKPAGQSEDNSDANVTSNGAAVAASIAPSIKNDAYIDADKKDIAIRVRVPDMCDLDGCVGGPRAGQKLIMVVSSASGIKNPSEEGEHSAYIDVLAPSEHPETAKAIRGQGGKTILPTFAKIKPSKVDGKRGDMLTVTGSGFKKNTSAGLYVLSPATTQPLCATVLATGTRVGAGTVSEAGIAVVEFEVTVPTFMPGNVNWMCMVDGTGIMSSTDVEDYKLKPSVKVSPATANVGDTVTVFAQDFPSAATSYKWLKLAGQLVDGQDGPNIPRASHAVSGVKGGSIGTDGSATVTFPVPGYLEGTVKVEAAWTKGDAVEKADTTITIIGSQLKASKSEALPNELITITGDGFGTGSTNAIDPMDVTIDDVPLTVHKDSLNSNGMIDVSSSGQFVASVILWPTGADSSNPTLTAGVHTIEVEDKTGYSGSVAVTIPEPVVTVTPNFAGPRDVITISGESWPVDNIEGQTPPSVKIDVDDGRPRVYSALPDSAGRWFVEHRVASQVGIPSTNRITASLEGRTEIVKLVTFDVPSAIIEVTPGEGQPGTMVTLSVDKMPVYSNVDSIQIAGREALPVGNFSTDRDGSVTVEGVVIPGLDPGVYSILMDIDDTVAIGSVEVLAEVIGTDTAVAEATEPLGGSLSAVFFFDNVTKSWSFYDPRPEFAELNTLTSLINGEAYWVLVTEDVDDVVLNSKSRSLSCSNGDCWNLVIW